MSILINFIVPIMFTALTTELTCLLERAKENGGARLVLTPEAFMPKYAELDDTEGEEPLFFPFTDRHHSLAFQAMTLSGALPAFRPNIYSNEVFGITSMFSSYLDYSCDDIEDLEYCQEQYEEAIWYDHIEKYMLDDEDERECLSFMIDPEYDEYIAKTDGTAILQCSAVFNLKDLSSSYSIEKMGEIVSDFVKNILFTSTIDVPDFEILPIQGAKAIMEFHKEEIPTALPLGDCTDTFDVDALVETKKNMALNETRNKPVHIVTIDEENIDAIPEIITSYYDSLK